MSPEVHSGYVKITFLDYIVRQADDQTISILSGLELKKSTLQVYMYNCLDKLIEWGGGRNTHILSFMCRRQCSHDGGALVTIDNLNDEIVMHDFAVNSKQPLWIGLYTQKVITIAYN